MLVGSALVLMLAGIASVWIAGNVGQGPSYPNSATVRTPSQIAKGLIGRSFTRDVVPPELGDAPALRNVFVSGSIPGLVGESTTSTSNYGATVTYYVFVDPLWAEAFFANPPIAYGCGVCVSMADGTPVPRVGDRAMSYVLYRKSAGGQSWIATTTYAIKGAVVIDTLYFPVNVASPSPSATDLYTPTAYAKAALGLLQRVSAG